MMLASDLATRFAPVTLGLGLSEEPGFTPPRGIIELRGQERVAINVALGVHYFFTCLGHGDPTFEVVEEFAALSKADAHGLHVFRGPTFSEDSEMNSAQSQRFSKFVGIAFMAQHAGATWFSSLRSLWNNDTRWARGTVRFEKEDADRDGPDYIAAPFDPTEADAPDPLSAIEFKGRVQRVDFSHSTFADWRAQAANVQCLLGPARTRQQLKAWVLAFNYAFEAGQGCRPHSTLLVDDPITGGSDAPPLEHARVTIEPIVREHLARQCRRLGAGRLAPSLLTGPDSAPPPFLPTTYVVRHPRLAARRYVGWFASWGPGGELIWASAPSRWLRDSDLDFDLDHHGGWIHVRVRGRTHIPARVEVYIEGGPWRSRRHLERWLRQVLGGEGEDVFVGQDANMLRAAITTAPGRGLDGEPFQVPIEFSSGSGEGEAPYAIQVLRNGGLFADARAVDQTDDDGWWSHPQ